MSSYQGNAKWLIWFEPFQNLSVSAAYVTPFFLAKGLSLSQVLVLQSIFSIASLLWEIPSGYIADKYGRALCIQISAPIAAVALLAYGMSSQFWQFAVCELLLAVASGFLSGITTALLLDTLRQEKLVGAELDATFVRISQRINAVGFASTTVAVPFAIVLVHFFGLSATLYADGALAALGLLVALKLVEPDRFNGGQLAKHQKLRHAAHELGRKAEVRWLLALGAALSTATYLGFWLTTPYYEGMGIPVVLFSAILALRSAWKAWLSHHFTQRRHVERNMLFYSAVVGLVYLGMATGQLWLVWVVLGHDVVQALQAQPITAKLNTHMEHEFRASLNSLVNLVQRLVFSLSGPLVGLLADKAGLQVAFLATGTMCSCVAFVAMARLRHFKTFQERR